MCIIDKAIVAIIFYMVGTIHNVKGTSEHGFNIIINDNGYFFYISKRKPALPYQDKSIVLSQQKSMHT